MLPAFSRSDPGIDRPILIDGVELSVMPADLDMPPEPVSVYHDMLDGGAREFQRRPYFDGVPNHTERWTYTLPYAALRGEDLMKLKLLRARGGTHRITVWRYEPAVYTCLAGVAVYYIPRFRKCAAHLYAGLVLDGGGGGAAGLTVSTDAVATYATLQGADLAVTYAEGPALDDPGDGGLVIARQPETLGAAKEYVPMRLGGDVTTGDELIVWSCWTHEVSLRSVRLNVRGSQEGHAYVFVEV